MEGSWRGNLRAVRVRQAAMRVEGGEARKEEGGIICEGVSDEGSVKGKWKEK